MNKYQAIYQLIIDEIQTGVRKIGDKLPSIRIMAKNLGVSKNTVITAYELLLEENWIKVINKSGYYITERHHNEKFQNISIQFINAYNGIELLGQQLTHSYQHKPGDGRYAREYMKSINLQNYLPNMSENRLLSCLDYGHPAGHSPLKESLINILKARKLPIENDNLMLTSGTNHSLDLIIRHFLNKGDTVVVESPGYYPLFSKLNLASIKRQSIYRSKEGYDFNKLEEIFSKKRPKIFFIQPFAHNPTGTDLLKEDMTKIRSLCQDYNVLIVEDDPFLLTREGKASYLFNNDVPTIYISSFSKTLTASLRCGFIVSSHFVIQSLIKMKLITMINTSSIIESIVNDLIITGSLDNHINILKQVFLEKTNNMLLSLQQINQCDIYPHNSGGLYAWFEIPIDDKKLASLAIRDNIFLAPGSLFFSSEIPYYALRINKFYLDETSINFIKKQAFRKTC